ncbi:MAG: hypothetical protein JWO98_1338 [Frankiales bacterium]|nr:hypothetical protein [Frankiales bacterium]
MRRALPRPGRPSRRARRLSLAVSGGAALILATALVWQTAYATFSVTTYPFSTTFGTGTVAITDDDAGTALFSTTGLKPGAAATRCLTVTSTGSVPALVRLYGTGRSTTKSLSSYLNLTVLAGTGGGRSGCGAFTPESTVYTGTLAAFPTTYGSGVTAWTTAGTSGETRTYQLTYSMSSSAPASVQTGSAAVAFTWQAQNT